ncbi:MAG: hypothetical protein E6K18_08170 [Methanobacteriota archaeon]|nr:MAG: hypothetical protein E6K18_08170 [Euryarchaeota archaeon]
MRTQRHALLSPSMERILVAMRDDPEEELTRSGRQWWIGDEQVNGADCMRLLQHCLIKIGYDDGKDYETFEITDDGRKVLVDQNWVPRIMRSQEEREAEVEAWTRGKK